MLPNIDQPTDQLHRTVLDLLRDHCPQEAGWLAARARKKLRDARITEESIYDLIAVSTMLVLRPDGRVDHILSLLEGNVLTHRVRARTAGRTDLWLGCGVQPLLNIAAYGPIGLADGSGEVTRPESGHEVLVGPPGWLPDIARYELIGLRITEQKLVVEPVSSDDLPSPEDQLRVRQMLSRIYQIEKTMDPSISVYDDELVARPGNLARAISLALLEDPELFATPYSPLDELLHNPLNRHVDLDHWRDAAVSQQVATVGFWVDGIPEALHMELSDRARRYGMPEAQFIVALLSTLAWRTPFAEDMEPWDDWDPYRKTADIASLSKKGSQS